MKVSESFVSVGEFGNIRLTPAEYLTSTEPFLHCCETWQVLAAQGEMLKNRPVQRETWKAMEAMQRELLMPLEERYGVITLTYGFAGPELIKAIQKRAREGSPAWLPNISPNGDQHAGHELNTRGNRICKRDGIAVDLRVRGQSSEDVAQWIIDNLPFDRIYLYNAKQSFHLSWAPAHLRVGQVVRMVPTTSSRLMPKVVVRGRKLAGIA